MSELAELLERFRRGAELVAVSTTGAACRIPCSIFKPGENKWGVRTIVCHLADSEIVLAMRLRQIIAEDHPALPGVRPGPVGREPRLRQAQAFAGDRFLPAYAGRKLRAAQRPAGGHLRAHRATQRARDDYAARPGEIFRGARRKARAADSRSAGGLQGIQGFSGRGRAGGAIA